MRVVIFEGVNDIGAEGRLRLRRLPRPTTPSSPQAHAQNLRVYGATITPFGGNPPITAPAHESTRQTVNTYIRSGTFDGVIDFDAAVRDTSIPPEGAGRVRQRRRLRLNPAGYRSWRTTVNLALFAHTERRRSS